MDYIREIEKNIGMKAKLNMMPMQDGDVKKSHADITDLIMDFGYTPEWDIKKGIYQMVFGLLQSKVTSLPRNHDSFP